MFAANRPAMATFSRTVSHGISRACWNTTPVCGRATPLALDHSTVPVVSVSRPAMTRSSVDLPLPLRPRIARKSPSSMVRSMSLRTWLWASKRLWPPSIRTVAAPTFTFLSRDRYDPHFPGVPRRVTSVDAAQVSARRAPLWRYRRASENRLPTNSLVNEHVSLPSRGSARAARCRRPPARWRWDPADRNRATGSADSPPAQSTQACRPNRGAGNFF